MDKSTEEQKVVKFWTDVKIAETLSLERVIKPQSERKPRNYLTNNSLAQLVSERNGFVYENVKEVLDDLSAIMYEQIISGNRVYLPRIGSIYLTVKPPYKTNINLKGLGGKLQEHFVAPRFDIRFYRNEESLLFLKQREVTEQELDKIYYDGLTTKKEKEEEVKVEKFKIADRKM